MHLAAFGRLASAAGLLLAIGTGSQPAAATAADDPLGCAERVFDPSDIATASLDAAAERVAADLDANLHVRIEGTLDGDIDGREAALEAGCAGWLGADGVRASDLLVVMVSPRERQTSIYYGTDYADTLIPADPQIQQYVMNPRFQAGEIEQGLADGLDAIVVAVRGGGVPQAISDSTYTSIDSSTSTSDSSSSGDDFPVTGVVALVVLLIVVGVGGWWAEQNGWTTSSSSSGYRRSWSSSSSSRSFSSSSHHSSSSHSSSSSSHHSGGGGSSSSW